MTDNLNLSLSPSEKNWTFYNVNRVIIGDDPKAQEIGKPPQFPDISGDAFCFTHMNYRDERALITQIENLINQAIEEETYLLICSFVVNSNEIIKLLKEASSTLMGKIYLIVGNQKNTFLSFNQPLEPLDEGLSSLVKSGAVIRYVENAHLKFISNGKQCLICTTNLTSEGLFKNPEFGVLLREKSVLKALNRLFSYLWFKRSNSILISDNWIDIPENSKIDLYPKKVQDLNVDSEPKVIVSSKSILRDLNQGQNILSQNNMYEQIIGLLNSAEESIDLAIYILNLNRDNNLKRIKRILLEKAKGSVSIRILVPMVKVNYYLDMKNLLEELETKENISIRYYRELHGKCLIIDKTKVLLMTGNIDRYLLDKNSCDIGCVLEDLDFARNCGSLYNHLWEEAAEECDANLPINLHLDLVIRAYDLISYKPLVSVKKLKYIASKCDVITLFHHERNALLSFISANGKKLNLYFELKGLESLEYLGDALDLSGIINERPNINLKKARTFSVKKLDLRLLWET